MYYDLRGKHLRQQWASFFPHLDHYCEIFVFSCEQLMPNGGFRRRIIRLLYIAILFRGRRIQAFVFCDHGSGAIRIR